MKVLVIGSNGQLGNDLIRTSEGEFNVIGHTREDWDITNWDDLGFLDSVNPDIIVNTAAFHNTEECEKFPKDALKVNFEAVKNLANYCKMTDTILMHVSTDWVFDGGSDIPYLESSETGAINSYGGSKLRGEEAIKGIHDSYYIVRISSVFGESGVGGRRENFPFTIMKHGAEKDELRVVDDIVMSPTYSLDAAKMMWSILSERKEFGVYHANNEGHCSWYQFACSIIRETGISTTVIPIGHEAFPTIAKRPMFSAMSSEFSTCGRPWEEALCDFLERVQY